ncbi:MAG: flagellar M-ring protein FliF [Oscillospiraceae bacterium]|nr:flagellar M-ring protein FliF [Oscillospiraceae bacterium]
MEKVKETFLKLFNALKEKWGALSKNARLVTMAVSASVVVALITLILLSGRTSYAVLYSGVPEPDLTEITTILSAAGITYERTSDGSIRVPKEMVDTARMELALAGYPRAGVDYGHWEESVGMFSTDFEKKEAQKQQLEIRIAATLRMLNKVENAVVTITMPPDKPYVINENKDPGRTSVMLALTPGAKLTKEEIEGVQRLVLTAVPGLTIEDLGIVDQNMMVLIPEDLESAETALFLENQKRLAQRQYQKDVEEDYKRSVEHLLEGTVRGYTVSVGTVFDFSNWTEQSKVYTGSNIDPETGMQSGIISDEQRRLAINGMFPEGLPVGTFLNADISPDYPTYIGDNEGEIFLEQLIETNYMVNERIKQSETNGATLEKITLAVQIDETDITQDEIDDLRFLLSRAVGAEMEDVAVSARAFNLAQPEQFPGGAIRPERNLLVFIIISLGALLIVLFLLAIMSSGSKKRRLVKARLAVQGAGATPAFADEGFGAFSIGKPEEEDESLKIQSLIGAGEGETREGLLKNEIREFAQTNPEIVAQLIRTWIRE